MSQHQHRPQRIAQGAAGAVDACGCGNIHVHVGAITLHVTPQVLRSLALILQAATLHVQGEDKEAWPVASTPTAGVC